jgi:restriction system protein
MLRKSRRRRLFWRAGIGLSAAAGVTAAVETQRSWAGMSVSAAVLAGWVTLPLWAKARRIARYLRSGLREIDAMTGPDFEHYVAARLRAAGYRVAVTKATGDFGVDLIASKGKKRIAIQCKRHGRNVGAAAVQQVVAGAVIHRCTQTMVVSNQEFTPAAVKLAHVHACELVGRARLPRWTRSFR